MSFAGPNRGRPFSSTITESSAGMSDVSAIGRIEEEGRAVVSRRSVVSSSATKGVASAIVWSSARTSGLRRSAVGAGILHATCCRYVFVLKVRGVDPWLRLRGGGVFRSG